MLSLLTSLAAFTRNFIIQRTSDKNGSTLLTTCLTLNGVKANMHRLTELKLLMTESGLQETILIVDIREQARKLVGVSPLIFTCQMITGKLHLLKL